MATTIGKVTMKRYRCRGCGRESMRSTNNYGDIYITCNTCSWKTPPELISTYECLEPLPEDWERPEPWKVVKLGDIADIVKGGVPE
jgi:DNA-directed RNA polymerase subunit RPC12/RpoP